MTHLRNRLLTASFLKGLSYWPSLALLGPRQSGKSTFLKELMKQKLKGSYFSLDEKAIRLRAEQNPELFLNSTDSYPLIIDEAQKAPSLFDEIKASIDKKRIPGQFILSGSVQFSNKTGIRESLTGRIATFRMDTMTFNETKPKHTNLKEILKYLDWGGMPGVCFTRDNDFRKQYWDQWLDTLCERDMKNYSSQLSGDLSYGILESCSKLDFPTQANIGKALRVDSRRIQTHLNALQSLFIVNQVSPMEKGIGKTLYLPFDAGLAHFLGATNRRKWQAWFLTEYYNQNRFYNTAHPKTPRYYLSTRHSYIDFVVNNEFHLFCDLATPERSELMTIIAAQKKYINNVFHIHCATDSASAKVEKRCHSHSWTKLINYFKKIK